MGVDIAFWLFAVTSVIAALAVVFIKDLFRAALCLVMCFFMVAGLYVTLNADLLAGLQLLIYVGAIALLLVFAIMLTRDASQANQFNKMTVPAALVAIALIGFMISSVSDRDNFISLEPTDVSQSHGTYQDPTIAEGEPTSSSIGEFLFSEDNGYLLIFEIAGALLLASVIGAMVLAREREK